MQSSNFRTLLMRTVQARTIVMHFLISKEQK
jgi:hypothetical protein